MEACKLKKLDELLATHLMGWRLLPKSGAMNQDFYEDRHEQFKYWAEEGFQNNIWSPTRNIAQALGDGGPGTVVGEMWKKEFRLGGLFSHPMMKDIDNRWEANFRHLPTFDFFQNYGQTPALATCLAACAALGIDLETTK